MLNVAIVSQSTDGQQFFIETAELPGAIDEVDFENPVAVLPGLTFCPHSARVIGMNIQRDFVVRDSFMRKLADQMSRDRTAIFPASLFRQPLSIPV